MSFHGKVREFTVLLDEQDWDAVHRAISCRQGIRILPAGGGSLAGRVLAEVCRGWLEFVEAIRDKPDDAAE